MSKVKGRTVYPDHRTLAILNMGQRSASLNQALECWAQSLVMASASLEKLLSPEEWKFLVAALGDSISKGRIDPKLEKPGELMAGLVRDYFTLLGGTGNGKKVPGSVICSALKKLSYQQAHALVWAIRWYLENKDLVKKGDQWWTVTYRARTNEKLMKKGEK